MINSLSTQNHPIRLVVRPRQAATQCRQDYLMMLAELNCLRGIGHIEKLFKADFYRLMTLPEDDLAKLISGEPVLPIEKTPDYERFRYYRHSPWLCKRAQICPLCLIEGHPIPKVFNYSLTFDCPSHGLFLINACHGCGRKLFYSRRLRHFCMCGFDLRQSFRLPVESWVKPFYTVFAPWREHHRQQLMPIEKSEHFCGLVLRTFLKLRFCGDSRIWVIDRALIRQFLEGDLTNVKERIRHSAGHFGQELKDRLIKTLLKVDVPFVKEAIGWNFSQSVC